MSTILNKIAIGYVDNKLFIQKCGIIYSLEYSEYKLI